MPDESTVKLGVDDLFEAAARGVLRGMQAREVAAERLVASGFAVRIDLIAGGRLLLAGLNPQPLPPEPPVDTPTRAAG